MIWIDLSFYSDNDAIGNGRTGHKKRKKIQAILPLLVQFPILLSAFIAQVELPLSGHRSLALGEFWMLISSQKYEPMLFIDASFNTG